jgi:hypothetical protein
MNIILHCCLLLNLIVDIMQLSVMVRKNFTERATEEFNAVPLYSGLFALALND